MKWWLIYDDEDTIVVRFYATLIDAEEILDAFKTASGYEYNYYMEEEVD